MIIYVNANASRGGMVLHQSRFKRSMKPHRLLYLVMRFSLHQGFTEKR